MLKLTTYDMNSFAAKRLAKALGDIPMHNYEGDHAVTSEDKVINWGRNNGSARGIWLNVPSAIAVCVDKFKTYAAFTEHGVPTPKLTHSFDEAVQWYNAGHGVYCRDTEHGMKGEGITFHQKGINDVPLRRTRYYTARFYTTREFRVYTINGQTMVFEKKRRNGTNPNEFIRANDDWVYCLNNLERFPDTLRTIAIQATEACGLDFAGIDCALDANGNIGVFEVNSAPYLDERAAEWMAGIIKGLLAEQTPAVEHNDYDIVDELMDSDIPLCIKAARYIQELRA